MTERTDAAGVGWFAGVDPSNLDVAIEPIVEGTAEEPRDWPRLAVQAGFADSEEEYYDRLHEATLHAAREEALTRTQALDRQLIHGIRAMDDCTRTANELAERLAEWAGDRLGEAEPGIEWAQELAQREPADPVEERIVSLARRVVDLADEREALQTFVETETPRVAPNLAAMAGPVLAARLIALAGGLEPLAKKPSGTLQVLGAEDALFAHLAGRGPSPKHGAIYAHEYVRGTAPGKRGAAARVLAGKLSIAARVDRYSGERKPELDAELDRRIDHLRSEGGG